MRSVTRLCSLARELTSTVFSAWLLHIFKIVLLASIVAMSACGRVMTDLKYNAMIRKRTSRFVYRRRRRRFSRRAAAEAEALECAICITEFVDGEVGTELESCGHKFHAGCIERWLVHGKGHASCPLCRVPVVQDGVVEEHRIAKSEGRLISNVFEVELGLLLLPVGLRWGSCCRRSNVDCSPVTSSRVW
nr:RING-H2 finger protein ATL64-like [Ipomoea trifida]